MNYYICSRKLKTGVAQLVEHWSPKPGVGSSSLSSRAKAAEMQLFFVKTPAFCEVSYNDPQL